MSDPTPPTPPTTPAAAPAEAHEPPEPSRPGFAPEFSVPPGRLIATALLLPVIIISAGFVAEASAQVDAMIAILSSMAVAISCAVALCRVPPRWVAAELALIVIMAWQALAPLTVLWLVAAILAGTTMAVLIQRQAHEDDFYFLPCAVAVLALVVMISLGLGPPWQELARAFLETRDGVIEQAQRTNPEFQMTIPESQVRFIGLGLLGFVGLIWVYLMWIGSRLARLILGVLRIPRWAVALFRVRQRYIFLLITGLVLEILSVLLQRGELSYVAWPLLAWFAGAFHIEAIGIVLFMSALRRAMGMGRGAVWFGIIGVSALVLLPMFWLIGVMFGLLDVWMDFRKLDRRLKSEAK